jgi:LuxR family maltose regulon positive regulatory protein
MPERRRHAMIEAVEPAGESDVPDGDASRPDQAGIVARTELFARLGGAARVTVVSAPPGSGKAVLLRSWIDDAGLTERAGWGGGRPG